MKESPIIKLNWLILRPHLKKSLPTLGIRDVDATYKQILATYKAELASLPEYGPNDILPLILTHAIMLGAVYQYCQPKPSIQAMTDFYQELVMGSKLISWGLRHRKPLTQSAIRKQIRQAKKSQKANHPFTWQYQVEPGRRRFLATFSRCGACAYLTSRGMPELVPAMCALNYEFAKAGHYLFLRKQTLATHGPVCDCLYIDKKVVTTDQMDQASRDERAEVRRAIILFGQE